MPSGQIETVHLFSQREQKAAPLPPDLTGYVFTSPLLTFYHLVISKVQIEEEKHMQSSKGPTQDEPLGMPHGARHQHSNLGKR